MFFAFSACPPAFLPVVARRPRRDAEALRKDLIKLANGFPTQSSYFRVPILYPPPRLSASAFRVLLSILGSARVNRSDKLFFRPLFPPFLCVEGLAFGCRSARSENHPGLLVC